MSIRRLPSLICACALLAACRGTPLADPPKKAAAAHPELPTVGASMAPAAGPTGNATGALRKPAGAIREVSGTVALDAGYALQRAGGKIIASNGANALQLGDASLIAHNGSNLILGDGNRIISENGGGIISENGGGIISGNGAGLTGKVKWGLLEAPADPGFGAVLPAGGLALGVVDLASGKLLKLGEDDQGRPAFGVVTDEAGAFHIFLPADIATGVRVVGVPREGADPRLQTTLLASSLGGPLALDEDSAQVANDIRLQLTKRTLHTFEPPEGETFVDDAYLTAVNQERRDEYLAAQKRLSDAFKALDGGSLPLATKLAIALRLTDMALAPVKVEEVRSATSQPFPVKGAERPAQPGLVVEDVLGVLRKLRERVGEIMEAERLAGRDPEAYFAAKPYLRDADQKWPIRKPSDFDDFLIRGILANPNGNSLTDGLAFGDVLSDPDFKIGATALDTFLRANLGIELAAIQAAYGKDSPVLPAMEAELKRLVTLAKAGKG
ncbi:MAG: hypothetical protein JWM80_2737 [Cyanobacteria bacterium RYN_339]|nr:hypothetical protein [Cyanobacteria bacterium RYN_339]